jgi:hypothetical protein
MKVVCIDKSSLAAAGNETLSLNRIYDVLKEDNEDLYGFGRYYIITDDGTNQYFYKWRFITLKEWRKKKLERIEVYESR